MTIVKQNEDTGDFDLVDNITGETIDSVSDPIAARSLCRMYNEGE